MGIGRFYAGIGALVWHPPDNTYLLLKRSKNKDFAAEAWECVTGRVDQGEGFSEAVRREVYEELSVQARIEFIVGTMHFYRGDPRPENELLGVVYCCSIDDRTAIRLSGEHSECRWATTQEIDDLLPDGHWLGKLARRAEAIQKLLPAELWQFYRENGFDL